MPPDYLRQTFADNVRGLAERKKISLNHLADLAGLAHGAFFRVLSGEASPTLTTIKRIADALDVPAHIFLEGATPSRIRRSKRKKLTVLVVDDEELFHQAFGIAARNLKMIVSFASNVAEARNWLVQHSFDVVFLDLRLKGEHGLVVLNELRARADYVPVIIVSATHEPVEQAEAWRAGADDFLHKPFGVAALKTAVKRVLP